MNWDLLCTTSLYTEAAIIRGTLEENEIPVMILNKQDTMYNIAMGEMEIYVPQQLIAIARSLLQDSLKN